MEALRQTQKKYGFRAMAVAIIISLLFILAGQKPIAKGLILGTLFSVINFVLIGETLSGKIASSRTRTTGLSLLSIIFRFGLMATALVLAAKSRQFNFPATAIGLFMIQILLLGDSLAEAIRKRTKGNN